MRLSTATVRELLAEINSPVEAQASIIVDINVKRIEVSRRVDDTNLSSLHEVVGDDKVLLVRRDFDVVRANCGLLLIGVIETLDIV